MANLEKLWYQKHWNPSSRFYSCLISTTISSTGCHFETVWDKKLQLGSLFGGGCKDEINKPNGSFLIQILSKWQPDEEKVVEIKLEKILSLGFSIFDTITSPNSPFLNHLS
jgi:hypothetical protein